MAYPFRQWPTVQEFAKELERHGVRLAENPLRYERTVDSTRKRVVIDPDTPILGAEQVRWICRRLGIQITEIDGFHLG